MDNEINFYAHCDEENCTMGSAEYNCPNCKEYIIEYGGLWYDYSEYNKRILETICPKCNIELVAKSEKFEWIIYIKII